MLVQSCFGRSDSASLIGSENRGRSISNLHQMWQESRPLRAKEKFRFGEVSVRGGKKSRTDSDKRCRGGYFSLNLLDFFPAPGPARVNAIERARTS